ncbi:MAG: hypothetical protein JXR50_08665 [Prolixibacteraceae bacterium]|nr:hypothetical protein [Prolixibacteraceae bacterium]MBN2649797.1 hypothetical protein [Prolixibacteraceae bacterium]
MKNIFLISVLLLSVSILFGQEKNTANNLDNILKQLSLTSEQKEQIDLIKGKYEGNKKALHTSTPSTLDNKEEIQAKFKENREIQRKKMVEIRSLLTKEQKVKMRKLRGAKKIKKE